MMAYAITSIVHEAGYVPAGPLKVHVCDNQWTLCNVRHDGTLTNVYGDGVKPDCGMCLAMLDRFAKWDAAGAGG